MNTPLKPRSIRRAGPKQKNRRAMALIIVLSSLVFLAALIVAFMSSVNTELRTSKRYADGINSDLLSQTAFNLAVTQITEATKGYDDPNRVKGATPPNAANVLAWATQPGMIRTYDVSGSPKANYRLYSWDQLKTTGQFNVSTDSSQLSGWQAEPAVFTDLNEPLLVDGVEQYPILNPNALNVVEGFSVATTPGGTNQVPMPVKWLYVLEDGQVVAPVPGAPDEVNIAGATEANQIVGRVAFWADDDTSKVNINTASEGSYVDMPRTSSSFDRTNLALNQPVNNEYQRYPGHPAQTSLSTVFPDYAGANAAEDLYPLTPRYMPGGSRGGTTNTIAMAGLIPETTAPGRGNNRLYASLDEFAFAPDRSTNNSTRINADTLEETKFFLTANSRAPELNLFNKPRVGIWPLSVNKTELDRTPLDNLIAFCLTMRNDLDDPYVYYFQRNDRFTTTGDLPASAVGSGVNQNRRLLEYLRDLTSEEVPGFSGNFATKYSATASGVSGIERDQILTQIFDYIRCTNLKDSVGNKMFGTDYNFFAWWSPTSNKGSAGNQQYSGIGQVVPIYDQNTGTKGFGRFPTVSKGVVHFIANAQPSATTIRLEAGVFFELFDPSQGLLGLYPEMKLRITGMNNFGWGLDDTSLQTMNFAEVETVGRPIGFTFGAEPFVGGRISYQLMAAHRGWGSYPLISNKLDVPTADDKFLFKGGTITIEVLTHPDNEVVQTISMSFPDSELQLPTLGPATKSASSADYSFRSFTAGAGGGRLNYKPYNGSWIIAEDVVRSVEANPGDTRLVAGLKDVPSSYFDRHKAYDDMNREFAHSLHNGEGFAFPGASGGRLVAANYRNYPGAGYYPNSVSLTQGWDYGNPTELGVAVGKAAGFQPGDLPGDWDNGFGQLADGPFINKPDEGSNPSSSSSSNPPYFYAENLKYLPLDAGHFSPNRQIPSAVMFGSLPSGVLGNKPWQTLHFRPGPIGHPGLVEPKDHLLLDLFHMPVVEPYAISEPLSTAGKINMNYQIAPFDYIVRETGLRAVLKAERITAIPDSSAAEYKRTGATTQNYRLPINADETLEGFRDRFKVGDIFRSASEICDIHLVPDTPGVDYDDMENYWVDHPLTGDNSRERPYATLYPRLTTKSNTFTIHVRAQALQKRRTGTNTAWGTWKEGKDAVISEYRGNQTVERYVDPNNKSIQDYASVTNPMPISDFYKIRVLATKQFAP